MPFTISQSGIITVSNSAANETYFAATVNSVTGDTIAVWSSDGANGGASGTFLTIIGTGYSVKLSDAYGEVSIVMLTDGTHYVATINNTAQTGHGIHVLSGYLGGIGAEEEYILDTGATGTNVQGTHLVRTSDGGVIGTWASEKGDSNGDGVLGLHISGSGVFGGVTHINTYTTGEQINPSVAALTGGGYVIAWESQGQDAGHDGIYMQRYDASGNKTGSETRVNTTSGDGATPDVSAVAGGYVVTWVSQAADGTSTIMGQRYASGGTKNGGEFQVSTVTAANTNAEVAGMSGGGFAVVWEQTNDDQHVLLAQVYDSSGAKSGDQLVVTSSNHAITDLDVRTLTEGFLITWSGIGADGSADAYMKRFGSPSDDGRYTIGDDGDDFLQGFSMDTLVGGAGNDRFQDAGDLYRGQMYGGAGNDTFHVITAQVIDGGDGVDEVDFYTSNMYTLYNTTIDLQTGSLVFLEPINNNWPYGFTSSVANIENVVTGDGNDRLYGNDGVNVLNGGVGDDILDGRGGADTMIGGAGNDTYYVDNVRDIIIDTGVSTSEAVVIDDGSVPVPVPEYDTEYSSVSRGPDDGIEIFRLTGSANLSATAGADLIQLFGNSGNNTLVGNAGDNTINGGGGADTMNGGLGNDTYIVDNAGDVVIEGSIGGTDSVYASLSYSLTGSYVENLFLTGTANVNATGNAGDNLLVGNAGNNVFNGGAGADTMNGGAGNDLYYVDNAGDFIIEGVVGGTDSVYAGISYSLTGSYLENLFLTGTANINATGNAGDNTLVGNSGNNVFNGGAGADSMNGGLGNDLYYVDNAGDVIIEGNGGGTDSVYAGISYSLTGSYLENLFLTGTANINATGNAGDNTLVGNSGNNVFNGGAGADTMNGGLGNDTYYVDNAGDVVVEGNGGGTDTVISSIGYSLSGSYVENLTLTGSANINLTGNGLANILTGNTGNNIFNGGAGNDILTGGGGNDIFWFGAGSGHDTISDFSADTINLNAYSHGVTNGGGIVISQVGGNTTIDLGGGNIITLTGVAPADLNGHIVW